MSATAKIALVEPIEQTPGNVSLPSRSEAHAMGKALREKCPRESHAGWKSSHRRADPVEMVLKAEIGRMPDLLPLRHGRMVSSPFTFYRGSALPMAADLATTPRTGVRVECCGDAHLCNFGCFATPERRIIFSINDLDETLPAPWEWDVKRLATSFVVACRDNGLSDRVGKDVAETCVRTYRESMAEFSKMKTLELWYYALEPDELFGMGDIDVRKRGMKRIKKERAKSAEEELFPKLVERKGNAPIIKDQLPTIFHVKGHPPGEVQQDLRDSFLGYQNSLPPAYKALLSRYEIKDIAIKVVGIGSVGTSCVVILLMAGEDDPLFLQFKEARASVLEPYAGASEFPNHGQRVVNGYHLTQTASDMFLGWGQGVRDRRHYFVRQLRDVKISVRVETFRHSEMDLYAKWCGRALALSHARSGPSAMLSGYMGKSDVFDRAIATFAIAYADQNKRDHAALQRAVHNGRVKAVFDKAA
jgi:uncharacterized protein (DUF2252 family)